MIIALVACSNNGVSDDYGSFTIGKTYSYDGNYYAVSNENDTMIVVTVYSSDDIEVFSFEPCRRMDYWGICWENDSYNIWVQSGDLGVLCYRMSDEVWTLDYDAVRPDYIISRYDNLFAEEENAHETSASESINNQGYSVSPVNTFTSFDEIVNVWSECLDIDIETCDYINADNEDVPEDYSVSYQTDFQSVLSDMRRSDHLLEAMF